MILKREQIVLKAVVTLAFFFAVTAYSAPQFWNNSRSDRAVYSPKTGNYEESVNYQPGLNLYPETATLTDLYGSKGNQLCAPTAITHALYYLKGAHSFYRNLKNVGDVDGDGKTNSFRDQIRYFSSSCETDKEVGTNYYHALRCMDQYVKASGYSSYTFMLGPHSKSTLPNQNAEATFKRPLTTTDLRYYLSQKFAVILTIGWYKFNKETQQYDRTAGHFFNVYGYDYNYSWGNQKLILKVVNPWIDYTGRKNIEMYDDVEMNELNPSIDSHVKLTHELKGPGFSIAGYRALIEDLFLIYPYNP